MSEPIRGEHWQDADGTVRVMTVVEGYVVVRRKGAAPFLLAIREFKAAFTLAPIQLPGSRS